MQLASSRFNVRVEKRPEASFSQTIGEIRSWLDGHNLRSASITPVATREYGLGFEISFHNEDEASTFQRQFSLHPTRRLCEIAAPNQSLISDELRTAAHNREARGWEVNRDRSKPEEPEDPADELTALHEVSESITASGNYLAAADRLFAAYGASNQERLGEVIEKALGQSYRASQAVHQLHLLFRQERRKSK